MLTTTAASRIPLEELVEQILISRQLTSLSRHQLMLALLVYGLSERDCTLIDRLLYGVRKGLLLVVD